MLALAKKQNKKKHVLFCIKSRQYRYEFPFSVFILGFYSLRGGGSFVSGLSRVNVGFELPVSVFLYLMSFFLLSIFPFWGEGQKIQSLFSFFSVQS